MGFDSGWKREKVNYFSFCMWIFHTSTCVAVIVLRKKMPIKKFPRIFTVPLPVPILMGVIGTYLVLVPFIEVTFFNLYHCLIQNLGISKNWRPWSHFRLWIFLCIFMDLIWPWLVFRIEKNFQSKFQTKNLNNDKKYSTSVTSFTRRVKLTS